MTLFQNEAAMGQPGSAAGGFGGWRAPAGTGPEPGSLRETGLAGDLSPGKVTRVLVAFTVLLAALHLLAMWSKHVLGFDHARGLVPLFDFNLESNAPTWFSSALLLVAGIVALLVANRSAKHRWHWAAMGLVALLLSFDESAQVHELVSAMLRSDLSVEGDFSWTIVAIVSGLPVLLGAALFYGFIRSIPRETAAGLLAAGAVYVAGVVGVDTVAALAHAQSGGWVLVTALNTVEELLEMLGVIMLIHVLLTHLLLRTRTSEARPHEAAA